MLYLFLDSYQIKLLFLKKGLLGQYDATVYQKKLEVSLLQNGKLANIDLIASAVKEALATLGGSQLKEKEVFLVLPQSVFEYFRSDMPVDITTTILNSYLVEKARAQLNIDLETSPYNYLIQENEDKKQILFYAIDSEVIASFEKPFELLDLQITGVIPEPIAYFKLFEKTLRKDKKETILYVNYDTDKLNGYLYDSFGLIDKAKWTYELKKDESVETVLKDKALDYETQSKKLNRLILSGEQSETIRQDTFTKQVGVWTNPLKRIIPNFYQDYVKMLSYAPTDLLSFLQYDAVIGAFIFTLENKAFSLVRTASKPNRSLRMPSTRLPSVNLPVKTISLFLLCFGISFAIIYFSAQLISPAKFLLTTTTAPSPTQTLVPTIISQPSATPEPEIDKTKIKVKILNGSGIKGKASTVKDFLKEKGYADFVTGNASSFDYKITEIQIKKDKQNLQKILAADIEDNVDAPKFGELDADEVADILIVVGTDFK